MNRGYKFISFILFSLATHVRADVIDLRENLFAKANTEEGLNEPAVRIDSQSNLHRSSLQYLVSASGTRLPIQFVSQTDPSRKTFIFIGGLDSDIETFSKLEEILLPLGYGSLRIELRGQGSLIAKPPNIESLSR